jgi:hypothetical protein
VRVTVIEGDLDEFGGRSHEDFIRPGKQSGMTPAQPKTQTNTPPKDQPKTTVTVSTTRAKRQHSNRGARRLSAELATAAAPLLPQGGIEYNPLPDNATPSLYVGSNSVGSPPGKTVRGARTRAAATDGTENPGSENFTFGIPVCGLSGRGIDAALDLVHNSQLFHKSSDGVTTYMNYNVDSGWPTPGWRLGYGQIENQGSYGMTLTDANGTRHALAFTSNNNADTTDGTFIHYTGTSGSGTLYYSDGTQVTYGAGGGGLRIFPTQITDRNGNYILISYVGGIGPKISSIEDTLKRHVTFYYAPNGDLVTIRAPGLNGSDRAVMRFYYGTVTLTTSGLFGSGISLDPNTPSSIHAITSIYLPNSVESGDAHIGYTFDYTSYGMMYQVQQFRGMTASWTSDTDPGQPPTGGIQAAITTYNYEGTPTRSIPSGGLSDSPDYTQRSDDWAGRVGSQPIYQFSNNKTTGISTVTAPDTSVSETHTTIDPGQWDDGLVSDTYIDRQSDTVFLSHTHVDWDPNSPCNPRVSKITTTDEAGNSKAIVLSYTSYNNVSVVSEQSFTGVELRRTETTYEASTNYTNRHLLHLPTIVQVFPGGSTTAASRVDYKYDEYGASHADLTHRDDIIAHEAAFDPFQQTVRTNCHWECWDWEFHHCYDWEWVCTPYNPYDAATDYRGNVTTVKTYPDASSADPTTPAPTSNTA